MVITDNPDAFYSPLDGVEPGKGFRLNTAIIKNNNFVIGIRRFVENATHGDFSYGFAITGRNQQTDQGCGNRNGSMYTISVRKQLRFHADTFGTAFSEIIPERLDTGIGRVAFLSRRKCCGAFNRTPVIKHTRNMNNLRGLNMRQTAQEQIIILTALDPDAIRAARRAAGYSLRAAGRAVGRDPSVLARYERGEVDPFASVLGALAGLYGVGVGTFYTQ